MGNNESAILQEITNKTQSELILFFIILTVVLIAVLLPLYAMILKDRKAKHTAENARQDKYIEREKRIIEVITANTEIMAGLKATLESNGATTNSSLIRMYDRMDEQNNKLAQIQAMLDRSINNQTAITDGMNKILLIVDNIPHDSHFGKGGLNIEKEG